MSNKKALQSILWAASIALLSTACGGGSGSGTVDLTVKVPTTSQQKKGKSSKNISVEKVKGVVLDDGTEVEGVESNGEYTVKVPEGSDVHIVATVKNEDGSECDFECFVNDATESDQVVDEDSTRVASLVISEGVTNDTPLKELLGREKDIIKEMADLLKSFDSRDSLNDVLDSSGSNENLTSIAKRLEAAIKKLNHLSRLLALLDKRFAQFENGGAGVKIHELEEDDIKNLEVNDTEESDDNNLEEFIARPNGVRGIAVGEPNDESDLDLSLNDDGSVSVERGDHASTTPSLSSKGRMSGHFLSGRTDGLTIKVKREGVIKEVVFSFSSERTDLTALVKTLRVGDKIVVRYSEVEDKKIVKGIRGEGFLSGKLTAYSKTSVSITLADGSVVEMPIRAKKKTFPLPQETGKGNKAESNDDPILQVDSEVETNDISVLSELEDNDEIEVDSEGVAIGDAVIVHWKIVENVKVASGVFPDKPRLIERPIVSTIGSRQTTNDGDKEAAAGDGIKGNPGSR